MTYDELLASLTLPLDGSYYEQTQFKRTNALRAVVELELDGWDSIKNITYPIGKKDLPEFYYKLGLIEAKAQIIQAIEKELK